MKKIIISIMTVAIGVVLFSATSAFADAAFNNPGSMPTVTVTNATTNPCNFGSIDGCWKTSASAKPGEMIAVHLYFKNTSNETANNATLGVQPSRNGTLVTFNGGVAATNAPRATGTATVTLSQVETITNMPQNGSYQADWYPNASSSAQPVNTDQLFGSGFPIGNIAPGQQGVLVVRFMVNGTPTPPAASCVINSFNANPSSIALGNSSSLSWNTSNCTYVNISSLGNSLATDNSGYSVSPTNTTTYTLTAYPGGATATTTVTVTTGGGNNNSCVINSFRANPNSISYGGSSNLTWNTTNCTYVNISGIGNNLSASDNRTVYPTYTQTYTLTAYPGGQTQSVTVSVGNNTCYDNNCGNNNNYCYINSFYADSNSINQGQTTILHWNTSGTNTVYISGFGSEPASGSLPISPYASTSYTLTLNGNNNSNYGYSNCSGNTSQSVYVTVNQGTSNAQPQAITTVASVLNSYAAVLNGIAVPNTSYGYGSTSAWFEYGPTTGLGNRTNVQAVGASGSNPYSANISGLIPHNTYYYRAVVQNQNGTAYGSIVPFSTPGGSTYTPPTRVIVQTRTVTTNNGIIAKSQASLFKLEVNSDFDHMCIGGNIDYTVNYQNISSQDLQNTILRITFPGELTYASSSQGDYDVTDRTLTISLGTVQAGEQGNVTVHAQVNSQAVQGKLSVITATMVYTNPLTHAQEQAIAYSLITISNDCPAVLGASVFGFGGFLPQTLLQWLLLILVILALIVLARALYKKNEPAKTV